jgi:hypothetical protein
MESAVAGEEQRMGTGAGVLGLRIEEREWGTGTAKLARGAGIGWPYRFVGGQKGPYEYMYHSCTPESGPKTLSGVDSGVPQTSAEL